MATVRLLEPRDRTRWDDYVKRAPAATPYHLIGWKDVIERSFGHRTYYWLAEDRHGEITGVLPVVHSKSFLFGSYMVSLPYFNYGGVCADDGATRDALLDAAISCAQRAGAEHLELRHSAPLQTDLDLKASKVSMRLQLPAQPDELLGAFDVKLRSQIRRPAKEGMVAKVGGAECLDDFYHVFTTNMRDLGTPVYARDFFQRMLAAFPDSTWIATVYKDRVPVASGFLIGFRESLEIPWASSIRAYNRFGPNMLLYWTALTLATEKGYRVFDFGRSTPDGGTYKFKAQWGAKPTPLYWYYWVKRPGPLPHLNPANPKFAAAISLWKKLPLRVTNWIGPSIARNLP